MKPLAAIISLLIAALSLAVSVAAYVFSRQQFTGDYAVAAVANVDLAGMRHIEYDVERKFDLTVTNTSKSNLWFYVSTTSNGVTVFGAENAGLHSKGWPSTFQSQIYSLPRADAGNNSKVIALKAKRAGAMAGTMPTLDSNKPGYVHPNDGWLTFSIVNAANGRVLYTIHCTYSSRRDLQKQRLELASVAVAGEISLGNSNSGCRHQAQ